MQRPLERQMSGRKQLGQCSSRVDATTGDRRVQNWEEADFSFSEWPNLSDNNPVLFDIQLNRSSSAPRDIQSSTCSVREPMREE